MQSQALAPSFGVIAQFARFDSRHAPKHGAFVRDANVMAARPAIVLVHGGLVDCSGWEGVYRILRKDGYAVRIVESSTNSLADDVAATRRVVAALDGPVILVGHSYGGAVITEAGNDPKVVGLVYVAAFAPDEGESVSWLIHDPRPNAPVPPILAHVLWGVDALNGTITEAAWRKKPSWYLVAGDDKMIPPRAQWAMAQRAGSTVTETGGTHTVPASQPSAVAAIIAKATRGVIAAVKWT